MKYFHKLTDVDVNPLMLALKQHPELWNQNNIRKFPGSPHEQVSDIILRFNDLSKLAPEEYPSIVDEPECVDYPAFNILPVKPLVFDLMRMVEGRRLGRVMITKMLPQTSIAPHYDGGKYAEYYERYHITLQNDGGVFRCGHEALTMKEGEIWWFDSSTEHEVVNKVGTRITLIVDIS